MSTTRLAATLLALTALVAGPASAQAPAATHAHPRLYRLLEVVTEPGVLLNPSPYPGYTPSNHPLLDAAPNLFRLVSLGLYASNSTALNWVTSFVPAGLRLIRVTLYGPPYPATRRETALWVVAPNVLRMKRNYQQTGRLFAPALSRPLFPRLHALRHSGR